MSVDDLRHKLASGAIDLRAYAAAVADLEVQLDDAAEGDVEIGVLGAGAMGEVVLVRDGLLKRHVAKKRMLPAARRDPALARRFLQEVQIMAQLDHPNIVHVHRMDGDAKAPAYTMELVRGETLEKRLTSLHARVKAGEADFDDELPPLLEVFLKICEAVDYAHQRGVIHRDLKPENVMIGAHGEALVLDWGIARRMGRGEELAGGEAPMSADASATQTGTAIGTPHYMSPEQANGHNDQLDGRSDQYALGLILGEIVTLRRLRTGKNTQHVYARALDGELDPLAPALPGLSVPPALAAIVRKATQLHPKHRYATVGALADDVRCYLRDEEITALPDGPRERLERWVGRHRDATIAAVLGLALALVLIAITGALGGMTALEARRLHAAQREEAIAQALTQVALQAQRIDGRFEHFARLLSGLAASSEHALAGPPREGFELVAPPEVKHRKDLVRSRVYADELLITLPTVLVAPGAAPAPDAAPRLASLAPTLFDVVAGSESDASLALPHDRRVAMVANEGVPVVWAYVATEDGLMVTLPGAGGYPDDYDARTQYWYTDDRARGPVWHAAKRDESDKERLGSLVTCSHALWDGDRFLGVAALDVSLKHVVDELLAPPGVDASVHTWLVDAAGQTVATSAQHEAGASPAFPHAAVLPEFRARPNGHAELGGDATVLWARLPTLDWTYAVVGPPTLFETD